MSDHLKSIESDLAAIEALTKFLNLSDEDRLNMVKASLQRHAPHLLTALPDYVIDAPIIARKGLDDSSRLTKWRIMALLKDQGIVDRERKAECSPKLLGDFGMLKRMSRQSGKDKSVTKHFWSATDADLKYDKNVTLPDNFLETQPHWYAAKFPELLKLSGMDKF